jgi:hypothetical protein
VAKHKFHSAHFRIHYCKKHKYAKLTFNKHCRYAITDKDAQGKSLHYRDMSSVWYCKQEPRRGKYKHLTKLPDTLVRKMLAYSSHENNVVADFGLDHRVGHLVSMTIEPTPDSSQRGIATRELPRHPSPSTSHMVELR